MSLLETSNTSSLSDTNSQHNIDDPEAFLSWAKNQVAKSRQDRIPFERQWYLNLAFFFGRQWVTWVGDSAGFDFARLYEPNKKPWQVRLTTNKIRKPVLRTIAKLNQERPRGFVQPATDDDEDIAASRAAEKILEYLTTEEMELEAISESVDWWTVLCGTGFYKDYWDEGATSASGDQGTVRIDVLSPFHVFVPDLELEDIERQPWVAHVCAKSVDDLRRLFPDQTTSLEPTTHLGSGSVLNDKFLSALGIQNNDAKNAVLYYEMWIKPNQKFPEGVKVGWAGNSILYIEPGSGQVIVDEKTGQPTKIASPFVNGYEYPITKRIHYRAGKFYGDTFVTDMLSLQMEYNRARSQMVENRNRSARPLLAAQQGSLDTRTITAEPGAIVWYRPGFQPPSVLPTPEMPHYTIQDMDITVRDMDDVAQQGDIGRGHSPGRVESATAISFLQEESDAIVNLASRDKERAIEKLGRHLLYYVNTYWTTERSVGIGGRNEAFEVELFSSASTRGNTNFRIAPGSAQPMSRSAKQAMIMELMNRGAISVAQGLKYLSLGDAARLYEEMQIDNNHAERENLKLAKLQPIAPDGTPNVNTVTVQPFDNHLVHIQVHDDYCKRQEFETLDPSIQEQIRSHVFEHLLQLAQMNQIPLNIPPEYTDQVMTVRKGAPSQIPGQPPTPPANPNYVDPHMELELRRVYHLIVANGGIAPMPQPAVQSGGGAGAPPA